MLLDFLTKSYEEKREQHLKEAINEGEKYVLLHTLDNRWKEQLLMMDHLREGINLRSYGEKKPLTEFKKEGFKHFEEVIIAMRQEAIEKLFVVKILEDPPPQASSSYNIQKQEHSSPFVTEGNSTAPAEVVTTQYRNTQKVGRNAPCTCGSGKKFKHCHGKI